MVYFKSLKIISAECKYIFLDISNVYLNFLWAKCYTRFTTQIIKTEMFYFKYIYSNFIFMLLLRLWFKHSSDLLNVLKRAFLRETFNLNFRKISPKSLLFLKKSYFGRTHVRNFKLC